MGIINTDAQDIKHSLKSILKYIGENPNREGLKETPNRMIRSWNELFAGYKQDPKDIMTTFQEGTCKEMVVLKDIEFFSTCEHHFIPFFGTVSIGYIPNEKVIGISKLARLVEIYARRLQIQERMTTQIADTLIEFLNPGGVMVVCKAQHLCMKARGIKNNATMVTSAVRGVFKEDNIVRNEFMELIK